jgi:hypothetical protein
MIKDDTLIATAITTTDDQRRIFIPGYHGTYNWVCHAVSQYSWFGFPEYFYQGALVIEFEKIQLAFNGRWS